MATEATTTRRAETSGERFRPAITRSIERGAAVWRQVVRRRVARLEGELEAMRDDADHRPSLARIHDLLTAAFQASNAPLRPTRWWSGSDIERAWTFLHEAEEELAVCRLPPSGKPLSVELGLRFVDDALEHARRHGLERDARLDRLRRYRDEAEAALSVPPQERSRERRRIEQSFADVGHLSVAVLRDAHARSDATQMEAHAFRNRLLLLTAMLVLGTGALILVQWRVQDTLSLVSAPAPAHDLPAWGWLALITVFGAVGGLLTSVKLLSEAARDPGPFSLPVHQAIVKVVAGACVGAVGIVLIEGGVIEGVDLFTVPAVLSAAVVLGSGQQLVTKRLDAKAADILSA